jgi:hypothetical protein
MMNKINFHSVGLALFIVLIIHLYFAVVHRWHGRDGKGWEAIIDGDSKGYYAFLPAIFIYGDPSMHFFNIPGNESITRYYHPRFRVETSSATVNKNYAGVAVMMAPFFITGHLLAESTGAETNGYSRPYMLMTLCAAIFYMLAGLYIISRLLRSYGVSRRTAAIVVLLLGAGTNLVYYTAIHSAMAHVYSFFAISAFCYFSRMYFLNHKSGDLILIGLFLGLIIIIRPVNIAILAAIPFLSGSVYCIRRAFYRIIGSPHILFISMILFVAVISIQAFVFNWQVNEYFVWSYGNESFLFLEPHFFDILFSFRKGLFIYTPIMLFSIAGVFYLFRRSKFEGVTFLMFFVFITYILSSWWYWFYGDGFGLRAFIDFYPVLGIPLGVMLNSLRQDFLRAGIIIVMMLTIPLNLVQTYQYRYQIIHPVSMNAEKYRFVFLKTGDKYRDVLGGNNDEVYEKIDDMPFLTIRNQNARLFTFNKETEYGSNHTIPAMEIDQQPNMTYVIADLKRKEYQVGAGTNAFFVFTVEDKDGNTRHWAGFRLNDYPSDKVKTWKSSEFRFRIPPETMENDILKFYIWNQGKKNFEIKDLRINFHRLIPRD